jgi:hypothetical protein
MNDLTFEFHREALLAAWEARRWYAEGDPLASDACLAELDIARKRGTRRDGE